MSWRKSKFSDFIELKRGFDLPIKDIIAGEYPVVSSTSILGYHNTYKVKQPGVTIGRSGIYGSVQYLTHNFWPHNTALYVKNFHENIPKFVYYFLLNFNPDKFKNGAAVPTLNRNNFSDIIIEIPDKLTQIKIASILSSYDTLIENNKKQIKLLEEAAQRLYKEWFVDLHFPGYENVKVIDGIPEGWLKCNLEDIAFESGKRIKKENKSEYDCYLPIEFLPKKSLTYSRTDNISNAESSLISFNIDDILFGAMRPYFHKVCIAKNKGVTRTTVFVLNAKTTKYWGYLLMLLFSEKTIAYATGISDVGSTIPYVKWDSFSKMPAILPTENILSEFNVKIKAISSLLSHLSDEILLLEEARDRLLPKLMSGEIEVCT